MTCDHEWFEGRCVHCGSSVYESRVKVLPAIEEPGYSLFIEGKLIRTSALEPIYKMLSRIEVQLSDRKDKVIQKLMNEARKILKESEQ